VTIWGKILGGAAGFALGGPLGALLGLAAGYGIERLHALSRDDDATDDDPTKQIAFTIAVIALGAKMSKADGRVTRDEVRAFREVFHVPPDEMRNVARIFDLAKRDVAGYEVYARQIGRLLRNDQGLLEELIDALFHIAKQDGGVHPLELEFLANVARIAGLSDEHFQRLKASHLDEDDGDPYGILGVPRNADDDTLRRAWKRLVREHHPDALVARGLPPDFMRLAERKLAAINAAYDRIRIERGQKPVASDAG